MSKYIVLLCLIVNINPAQNIFETYYKAGMLYESGKYELARPEVEKCLKKFYSYSIIDYHPFVGAITLYGAVNIGLGNIELADSLFTGAYKYIILKAGYDSREVDQVYSQSAGYFRKHKCYLKAEKFYKLYLDFMEGKVNNRDDSAYAITLSDLGGLYMEWNRLDEAENYFKKASKIISSKWGENSQIYGVNLFNFASVYDKRNDGAKAKKYSSMAEDIILNALKKQYNGDSEEYAKELLYLGDVLSSTGFFDMSEPLYLKSLEIIKNKFGEDSDEYLRYMYALSDVFIRLGRFNRFYSLGDELLKLIREYHSGELQNYAVHINNIALLFNAANYYDRSFELISEVCNILQEGRLKNDSLFAMATMNMGVAYGMRYDYSKSEEMLNKSLDMWQALGDTSNIVKNLNSLALLHGSIGDYKRAGELLSRGLEIVKGSAFTDDYIMLLNSLGILNGHKGNYEESYNYFYELSELIKNSIGENSMEYYEQIVNLATARFKKGDTESSIIQMLDAGKHLETYYGKDSPKLIVLYDHLSVLYHEAGDYKKAILYADKALDIFEQNKGMLELQHSTLNRLKARYLYSSGKLDEALEIYKDESAKLGNYLISYFPVLSDNEKMAFKKSTVDQFDIFYSFALNMYKIDPSIASDVFNSEIKLKSSILTSSSGMRNIINNSNDEDLKSLFQEYIDKKKDMYKCMTSADMKISIMDIDLLSSQIDEIEKQLAQKSAGFGNEINMGNYTWKDVQSRLNDDEALIDFIDFRYYYKKWTGDNYYMALIITRNMSTPDLVFLCKSSEIEPILSVQSERRNSYVNDRNVCKILSDLIWKPVEEHLQGVKKLYISPSGILNRVSYFSLSSGSDLLIDKYDLVYLRNPADIIDYNPVYSVPKSAVVIGGIDYDKSDYKNISKEQIWSNRGVDVEINEELNRSLSENTKMFSGGKWNFLDGTLQEAESVADILKLHYGFVSMVTGSDASEEFLKSLRGEQSPEILHIATHGFFIPPPEEESRDNLSDERYGPSMNPLLRSGIILSGANKYWSGGLKQTDSTDDGILTAYEVSNMNLKNTELVVLSACETGLGDIKGGEGVFGLQRAFKIAGAKTIIISLWKVPDKETVELMSLFYSGWLEGKTKHEAFIQAQKEMRQKYDPYYWSAFIMIE